MSKPGASTISGCAPSSISRRTASPLRRCATCESIVSSSVRLSSCSRYRLLLRVIAECGGSENLVAAIQLLGIRGDNVLQKRVVNSAVPGRNPQQARQRARHGEHAEVLACHCRSAPAPQKKRDAQRLVQHVRKRMRRIDGHRRQHRIHAAVVKRFRDLRGFRVEFADRHDADRLWRRGRQQFVVPTFVLVTHEHVHRRGNASSSSSVVRPSGLISREPCSMRCRKLETRISTNSSRLLAVMARNLTRSSSGIAKIARFFQHAPVEFQPLDVAIEIVARIIELWAFHKFSWREAEK